jgi:hypothetical protein
MQRAISWLKLIFLFSVTIILGLMMLVHYSWRIWAAKQSINWPTVTGEIIASTLQETHYKGTAYSPLVQYRYNVAGETYINDNITLTHVDPTNMAQAQTTLTKYPVGKTVAIHYHPTVPSIACLEAGSIAWENYIPVVLGPLFLLGGIFLFQINSSSIRLFIKGRTNKL